MGEMSCLPVLLTLWQFEQKPLEIAFMHLLGCVRHAMDDTLVTSLPFFLHPYTQFISFPAQRLEATLKMLGARSSHHLNTVNT